MSDDNRPSGPQDRAREGEIELTDVVSPRAAESVNKRLARLGEPPVRDSTETKIALAAWKVHDVVGAIGMITVFVAVTSTAIALNTAHAIAGWVAFSAVVALGVAGAIAYSDKRNWEAAKAVLEHRLDSSRD